MTALGEENYYFNRYLQIALNWFFSSNLSQQKFLKQAVQTNHTTHASMKGIYIDNSLLHAKENLGIFVQMPEYADDQVSTVLMYSKMLQQKVSNFCSWQTSHQTITVMNQTFMCAASTHCTLLIQLYRCVCLIQDVTHLLQGVLFPRIQKKGQRQAVVWSFSHHSNGAHLVGSEYSPHHFQDKLWHA